MNVIKKIGNALLGLFTFLTVISGTVGLTITVVNPVNLWWTIAPIQLPYGIYIITYSMVMEYLQYIQTYYYYSLGISIATILLGLEVSII